MCSIVAILESGLDAPQLREKAVRMSRVQRHRGPDWSGVWMGPGVAMAHERLAIVDVESGAQPLIDVERGNVLVVNGEIYNHRKLRRTLRQPYPFQTGSDCEVILALYREHGSAFLDQLEGMFAFVLYDPAKKSWLIARDHIGIIPLYIGRDDDGVIYVASEMKALVGTCTSVEQFPPGHFIDSSQSREPQRWYSRAWRSFDVVDGQPASTGEVREALEGAIRSHLMGDVPYGVLLSGGLDSSIVAAVAARYAARRVDDDSKSEAWWPRLHSFAIGLKTSPDLAAARVVAAHIGTVHHELHYTIEDGLDALPDVIYHTETYDVTSIRASTPMFLMARMIRAMGIKMVLSGEGSDEIFGGYLYFHKAPNARELHDETVRKLDALHMYDCLRANKSMAAWGVEARVPFLDKHFLDVSMSIDPAAKMVGHGRIEKQLLRDAFADLLPESIVKRQKEQFSDGVGYGWIDSLKAHAAARVTDAEFAQAAERFPYNPPATKEAYYYRSIFESFFPGEACARTVPGGPSVACSTPTAIAWDEAWSKLHDPSGRAALGVHDAAYKPG